MKFKENIFGIIKRGAIHCDTFSKAEALLNELDKLGAIWYSGHNLLDDKRWDDYKENTCYVVHSILNGKRTLLIASVKMAINNNYKIIEFEELEAEN